MKKRGSLTAIYGPMFSGKTTKLIAIYDDGEGIVAFKPDLDQRYTKSPVVISHDKEQIPAVLVDHEAPNEMMDLVGEFEKVLIDEANFFSQDLIDVVGTLINQGKRVYVAGLTLDSERNVWGPMMKLIDMADERVELFARCEGDGGKCREKAVLSYRKTPKDEQVRVAGAEEYGVCCERHYPKLHHPPKKTAKRE